jgi:hypothetical protein
VLSKNPWIAADHAAVARERSWASGNPQMKGRVGGAMCTIVRPTGELRFRRSGQRQLSTFAADRLYTLIPNPTIQAAHESAEKRGVSGPYPWRPPV